MAIDKNAVVKEAQKFVAKGQFDKAIAEWKKLLRETPNDPNLFNTIGDLCLKKNAKGEAVEAYRRAADILAEDGFTSKAIALYKKVLNIDPQKIEVYLALGDLNAEKGLTGAALETYKVAADHYIQQDDMPKALGIYQKMADMNPSNHTFRIKLGEMYIKEGMKAEAAKAYLDAAEAHMAKNAFQDARQLFEKVLALDPSNKGVYHKAGLVYLQEGKFTEACKALKHAFENNPSNVELANTYLNALEQAGKLDEAEEVIIAILTEDPSRTELREKLYRAYLAKNEFQKALDEVTVLAQAKIERGDDEAAEAIFKTFVSECPQFIHGRQKLAEFYATNFRNGDAAQVLVEAAEILATENVEGAKALASRALSLAPGMPEAKRLIEQLETARTAPTPAPPATAPFVETPTETSFAPPTPELFEEAPPEAPAAEPSFETYAEPTTPVEEESPAVNEAFTEADVLIKYGLPAKALEQLEGLAGQYPESARIRVKLRDLYRDQGNADKAAQHTLLLSDLYAAQGNQEMAQAELQIAYELAPENSSVRARFGQAPLDTYQREIPEAHFETAPAIPESAPSVLEEASPVIEPTPAEDKKVDFNAIEAELPVLEELAPLTAPEATESSFEIETPPTLEMHEEPIEEVHAFEVMEHPAPPKPPQERATEVDLSDIWAEAEFYYQQGLFDEARKYYAKIIELTPSDRRAIERLAEITREEDETREFTKLAEAVESLEEGAFTETGDSALAASASDDEAVRRLMREISQISKEQSPPAPPPRKEVPPPSRVTREDIFKDQKPMAPPVRKETPSKPKFTPSQEIFASFTPPPQQQKFAPVEDDFFDLGLELQKEVTKSTRERKTKAEDFFDLAAELKDELSSTPSSHTPVAPQDQSLDDIFEEFKKGVEQQAIKEDADTHYNLGVAYKEMGLLDDAIAEFIMTPEEEPRFVQSRYMLGLCYMEKGEFQNAIGEIQNAIDYEDTIGEGEDLQTRLGMQYDLGLAYHGAGNLKAALSEFQKIADVSPGYRDTAAKLKDLSKGSFLSLAQLKDDIEKEISAKFLKEGERIEREERSKRSRT
jgi:tetratricopeptide (TPR) repeat protein